MPSKEKVSGTMEYLTEEHTAVFEQFYKEMEPELVNHQSLLTKWSLLRFLRARNFKIGKAKKMLRAAIKFREEYPPELIRSTPISEFDSIYENYACGYCGADFEGNLIVVEQVGKSYPEKIINNVSEDKIHHFLVQKFERMLNVVMPYLSQIHGKRIERTTLIIDLKNVKSSVYFNSKIRSFLKISSRMGQDFYPETLGRCFVINAPMIFQVLWKFVSGLLDSKTKDKIFIEKDNGLKKLTNFMDVDQLPIDMGGKAEHDISELNGPWKSELECAYNRMSFHLKDRSPEYQYYLTTEERQNVVPHKASIVTGDTKENFGVSNLEVKSEKLCASQNGSDLENEQKRGNRSHYAILTEIEDWKPFTVNKTALVDTLKAPPKPKQVISVRKADFKVNLRNNQ